MYWSSYLEHDSSVNLYAHKRLLTHKYIFVAYLVVRVYPNDRSIFRSKIPIHICNKLNMIINKQSENRKFELYQFFIDLFSQFYDIPS